MIGNAGSSLKSIVKYADSAELIDFNGVAECMQSDGRTLEFQC